MANSVQKVEQYVVKEALKGFFNETLFTGVVDRDFNQEFEERGAKKGDTIFVKKPAQFRVRKGSKMMVQDIKETKMPVVLGDQIGVDFEFSVREATLDIDHGYSEYSKRFIRPAGSRLASEKDAEGLKKAAISAGYTTVVAANATNDVLYKAFTHSKAMLNKFFAPKPVSERYAFIGSDIEDRLADNVSKFHNAANDVTKAIKQAGMNSVGVGGLTWGSTDLVYTRINGAGGSTGTLTFGTNNANLNEYDNETQWLTVTGNAAANIAVGDTIEFNNIYFCNPETKAMYAQKLQRKILGIKTVGEAKQVEVYSIRPDIATDIDASQALTEDEKKAMRTKQAMANCYCANWSGTSTAAPGLFTVLGTAGKTYLCCPVMHKSAEKLTSVHLVKPSKVEMSATQEYKGVFIRFVEDYEVRNDMLPDRLDTLSEFTVIYPEWITVVEIEL